MSFRTVRKPHMKKSVVIIASALLVVERGADVICTALFTLGMAIGRTWTSQSDSERFLFLSRTQTKIAFYEISLRRQEQKRPANCRLARSVWGEIIWPQASRTD